MKGNYKKILYPALSLLIICLVSATLLAVVNNLTKDKIAEAEKQTEIESRSKVFPGEYTFEEKEDYVVCFDGSSVAGYIFVTEGKGYGGTISVMTGIDASGIITGVSVLSHSETSSYGGKAINNNFADEFVGKQTTEAFSKGKNIDGWTGATRTTNGVIDAVNKAREEFLKVKGGN